VNPSTPPTVSASTQRSRDEAYDAFLRDYPDYAATARLDVLRAADYHRLEEQQQVYLDYTGGSLYGDSLIRAHADLLAGHVFGNPHSMNPSSSAMTSLVEHSRHAVLRFFNAAPGEYIAIFTANATAGLKLVGEAYEFAPGGRALLTFDNHNSVNGIREYARARGARVDYAPLTMPELRIDRPRLRELLAGVDRTHGHLFAMPAQSNFSGVKHPLDLVDEAHAAGWDVLLDAAAFVPTNPLDLQAVKPDFVVVSFYKMFGYPTGVGCLLVRDRALARLHRPWFAGGTVNFATVQGAAHRLATGEAGFEDGTLNYLSIPAVAIGLRQLEEIGLEIVQTRVRCLTGWLLSELYALRHSNGRPLVRIYGPVTTEMRGGTIALNLYDQDGHLLDYRRVEELAGAQRISLRIGCFCNPGVGETAEGLTEADMLAGIDAGLEMTLPLFVQIVQHRGGKSAGAIRISVGFVSNFDDVFTFLRFVATFRDQTRLAMGAVTFEIETCRAIRDGS
jgi:selenocysteine lyase/cysteine desulfurase